METKEAKVAAAFHELTFYTLAHEDTIYFLHQHAVDAFTAQTAGPQTKPIALTFALAGLYLFAERHFTGRQVQQAHRKMAACKMPWPIIHPPLLRGDITIRQVLDARPGKERDAVIKLWAVSVWEAYGEGRAAIAELVDSYGNLKV